MQNNLKFRICYTAQNGEKRIIYNDERYLIGLDGKIYENYGKSSKEPVWENIFDGEGYLEQYTGLKTEDSKEIYAGDIVTLEGFGDEPPEKRIVQWSNHDGIWECAPKGCKDYCWDNGFDEAALSMYPGVKVIGNIFENPELL